MSKNKQFICLSVLTLSVLSMTHLAFSALMFSGQHRKEEPIPWELFNPLDHYLVLLFLFLGAVTFWTGLMLGEAFPWPEIKRTKLPKAYTKTHE